MAGSSRGSAGRGLSVDALRTIETLMDCIERLMEILRETVSAEKAQEIYDEFFGE